MQEIIINKKENDISVYVLEGNKLVEMYCYTENTNSTLGNIYNGRVTDIMNGMQAAFINIGLDRNALISVKDALKKVDIVKEKLDTNIKMSDILKSGQNILVQVKKEQTEGKGARVSTHVTIPGKYIVLMPNSDIVTISQKIDCTDEKERLLKIVREFLPCNFGAIIRTDAENVEKEVLESDIKNTISLWNAIVSISKNSDAVTLVYNDHDIVNRTIRDIINKNTHKVYVNDEEIYKKVKASINFAECIFDNGTDLISKFGLENEVSKVQNRKIYLKCGGHIVIDKTEALTAIDVNSGKYTNGGDLENTIFKVNIEAAEEIMRQIRLKDIGGIIVVDFIDMHTEEHKRKILETMIREAKKDRSKVDIKEFTKLNLVEMTRKKLYV